MTQQAITDTITIELDWPATALWPNRARRLHWAQKAAAASTARLLAKLTTLQLVRATRADVRQVQSVTITFHPPTRRKFDLDGAYAACKAYQDGIVNDALGLDDSAIDAVVLRRGPVRRQGAVVVTLGSGDSGRKITEAVAL